MDPSASGAMDRQLRDVSVMYELISSIGTSLDLQAELNGFLERLLSRFGYDIGAVALREEERRCFVLAAAKGFFRAEDMVGSRYPLDAYGFGEVVSSGEPLVRNAVGAADRERIIVPRLRAEVRSYAFLPIPFGGGVLGVLRLFSSRENAFAPKPLKMIASLLDRLGVAVHHARAVARLREAEASLRESAEWLAITLRSIGDAVIATDAVGRVIFMNPSAETLTAWTSEEAVGRQVEEVFHIVNEETRQPVESPVRKVIREGKVVGLANHTLLLARDGREWPIDDSGAPIRDDAGNVRGVVLVFHEVSEKRRLEAHLEYLADHDPALGLYNRRRFQKEMRRQLANARECALAGGVLLLDLDNFKYVNKSFGQKAGDEILAGLVEALRGRMRASDVLARLGGDEFAVCLFPSDPEAVRAKAAEFLAAVAGHGVSVHGEAVGVTATIGVALFPEHGETVEDLLGCADLALHRAKEEGGNRFAVYSPAEEEREQANLAWTARLRRALQEDRFRLHLQPILDLRLGRPTAYEALLRLVSETGEVVLPGAFLGPAERFGLMRDIDRWVVGRAVRLVAELGERSRDLRLHVNLSGKAVGDRELLALIERELAATGVPPDALVFEIVETAAVSTIREAQAFITALRALGCRFALDDFGVGFSSFTYLKHLPVDYLKIDGGFIRDLPHDPVDQHLVRAIVEVARGLGMRTVAEFVADGETVEILRRIGVDLAQGFHIGPPGDPAVVQKRSRTQ